MKKEDCRPVEVLLNGVVEFTGWFHCYHPGVSTQVALIENEVGNLIHVDIDSCKLHFLDRRVPEAPQTPRSDK